MTSGNALGDTSGTASEATAATALPEVDFMTAEGVVRGDSRQQVSVKGSAPGMSHVLGNLAERGIRAGASEAFTPTRSYSREEALAALFASGQMRGGVRAAPDGARVPPISAPENAASAQARFLDSTLAASQQAQAQQIREQLQAQVKRQIAQALADPSLNALLSPAILPMTVTDASGSVRLTLAGQAKAQEVYNRLRLSESYKKHANPAIAQAVTLNAGAIGLGSTMVGYLSAGASFDEAFQAGMKAGVVSAVAAGAAYGVNDYLGLNPTGVDATGKLTYSEAAMRYYRLSAVERLGTGTFWAQASSNAVTRGVSAQAQGGKFATGMVGG